MKNAVRAGWVVAALYAGCAGAASAPEPPAAAASSSGIEQPPQPTAAEPVTPADLAGTWVEYWAIDGKADTERYAFTAPDRFSWHASAESSGSGPLGKAGSFRLEPHGSATFLVLSVEQQTLASEPGAAPHEVKHRTPLIERHELGECPSNPEAQTLDAEYTCRAIGGKAFWRKTREPSASEPAPPAS